MARPGSRLFGQKHNFLTGLVERVLVVLVPDIGEAFEEQQREDVLVVVSLLL